MTDAQLFEQAQQGDSSAWQGLYERLLPSVWREVYARLGNRDLAEDIVSETFLTLVRNLPSLKPESCRLHGWVLTVARNKVTDWIRSHRRRSQVLQEFARDEPGYSDDPADELLADERRGLVVSVLESMRHDQRIALEWKYADRLSVREIAARLGQSEPSTQSLLYRARVEFRRQYELRIGEARGPVLLEAPPRESD